MVMVGAPLVLDTNIVLDLLVFEDAATEPLHAALRDATVAWLATDAMRTELVRVLTYPQIAARLRARSRTADDVLCQFDRLSRTAPPAAAAPVRCSDRDDQIFIDLAVAHQALLISKDRQVVRLHKRLVLLGVAVQASAAKAFGPGRTRTMRTTAQARLIPSRGPTMIDLSAFHALAHTRLGPFAAKPTTLETDQQEASLALWSSADGRVAIGIWECTPGRFTADRTKASEFCHFISGEVEMTHADGSKVRLGPGDAINLPLGWTGEWNVLQQVRKLYVITQG